MGKMKFYLLLPMIAVLAFGSISFAQSTDMDALKAEIRAELKAELKQELLAELKSETKADIQEATFGLRDVLRADFKDEIRSEIMQEDISSAVNDALAGSAIMGGLFKGVTATGFIDTNFSYNLRKHGESTATGGGRNGNDSINYVGENEDNSFNLNSFTLFLDKEATDEHPIGWQMHTYWGETAQRITFAGPGNDAAAADDGAAGANDRFAIATANITWNAPVFGKHVPITMGKIYTWIGYELVENIGNPNYTHGTVYNNAIPFTHTGMSFDVSEFLPSDKWGLTLYLVNGWDTYIDNNSTKSYGAYLTYQPNDDFFISLATINGGEGDSFGTAHENGDQTFMYDIVATYSLPQVDKLSLGFNWDHGRVQRAGLNTGSSAHWWAAVGYLMYDYTDNQQGAFRYEYFDNTDGAKAPNIGRGGSMWTATYTHNITIAENLLLRPEIRYNQYSDSIGNTYNGTSTTNGLESLTWGRTDENGNTSRDDSETILNLGVEYVF